MNEKSSTVKEHSTKGATSRAENSTGTPATSRTGSPQSGAAGPNGEPGWPVEPGRYRLIAARACPWANRTVIVRRLLGLEDAISLGQPGPTHDARSWTFDLDPDGADPVLGIDRLQEAYFRRFPDYPRGITVPAMVDIASGAVVTNNYPQITLDFSTEWTEFHRPGAPQLYPEHLREEIDRVNKRVFTEVNNGVYRCGFAGSQDAYDAAYSRLWTALDWLEERLAAQRYLVGDYHYRSRRPALHNTCQVRRRLPRAFQVQPEQTQRDAGPLGIRQGPVPNSGLWRHHRLRADQAALLHRPRGHQSHRRRPGGAGPFRVADSARAGVPGRKSFRRGHSARTRQGRGRSGRRERCPLTDSAVLPAHSEER